MKASESAREPVAPSPDPALSREAYALLALANVLRMRGLWEEAVERCMEALRLAPENASAHSLLGDIYENQGRVDDAIQWYRMALDVNPSSPADQLKLQRLQMTTEKPFLPPPNSTRAAGFEMPERENHSFTSGRAESLLRGVAWLAAALFLVVVLLGGFVMLRSRRNAAPLTAQTVIVPAPVTSPAGLPASSPNPPAPVQTSPDTPAEPSTPTAPTPGSQATAPTHAAGAGEDALEQSILSSLGENQALTGAGVVATDAQIDPRTNALTLTLAINAAPVAGSFRAAVLRAAVVAGITASSAAPQAIQSITVRVLAPTTNGLTTSNELKFEGDSDAASLGALGSNLDPLSSQQLLSAFHNVWWSADAPQ